MIYESIIQAQLTQSYFQQWVTWIKWLTDKLDFEMWMTAGCFLKNDIWRTSIFWNPRGVGTKMPNSQWDPHATPTREAFRSGRQGQVWDLIEAGIHPVGCVCVQGTVLGERVELGKYLWDSLRSMHVCVQPLIYEDTTRTSHRAKVCQFQSTSSLRS